VLPRELVPRDLAEFAAVRTRRSARQPEAMRRDATRCDASQLDLTRAVAAKSSRLIKVVTTLVCFRARRHEARETVFTRNNNNDEAILCDKRNFMIVVMKFTSREKRCGGHARTRFTTGNGSLFTSEIFIKDIKCRAMIPSSKLEIFWTIFVKIEESCILNHIELIQNVCYDVRIYICKTLIFFQIYILYIIYSYFLTFRNHI